MRVAEQPTQQCFDRSTALRRRARAVIPGGCHTYAKGDDQYPEHAPGFVARGKGCHVWDVDGNEFIEYGAGLRSVTLGHAHPPVIEAASRQMQLGSNFNRPAAIEVECAEAVLELFPAGEMIKFAKNGSDVTTAAVKLARAYTGRDKVAICADQPFFSVDDWFIGTTQLSAGIPQVIRDLTVTFRYNDLGSVREMFDRHPGQIACLILEAATAVEPAPGFLHELQRLCTERGVLLVLDEIITGFRWALGGAQACYQIEPDLCTLGKGMANGFALAALLGKRDIMRLGGLDHDQDRVFLLSTTNGAETHALAAARETIRIYREEPVIESLHHAGERLKAGIEKSVAELGLDEYFQVVGKASNLIYVTRDEQGERSQPFRTLFLQELIQRGVLAPSLVVNYSHSDADVDRTIEAVGEALGIYQKALSDGVEKYLVGRPVKPVNRRLN